MKPIVKKAEKKLQIGVYIVDSLEGKRIETVANETAGHGRSLFQEIILEVWL